MSFSIVYVPLDGSEHALAALPVARRLAALDNAVVHVLHVARRVMPPQQRMRELKLDPEELHGSVLDEQLGDPAEAILRVARERAGALIVMCAHTEPAAPPDRLGHVAEAVLRGAEGPVVLLQPNVVRATWELTRILLPHDGTPTSNAGVIQAADLARKAGARLSVLYVAAPGAPPPPEPGSLAAPRYLDQPQHEWPAWASEFLERLSGPCSLEGLQLNLALARGEPAIEIVRFARFARVDLIVIAWQGVLEAERAQVVRAVVHGAPCPTLILRSAPAP